MLRVMGIAFFVLLSQWAISQNALNQTQQNDSPELQQTQQNDSLELQQTQQTSDGQLQQFEDGESVPILMQQSNGVKGFKGQVSPTISERDELTHSFQIESKDREQTFYIHVALPYQYDEKVGYPVLYLLDADFLFGIGSETAWILNMGGQVPPMIVVGIGFGTKWSEVSNLRYTFFSPTPSPEYPKQTGKADLLLDFIENRLFPEIEQNYKVTNHRTLWGSSMGGLFSAYVLATKPTLFNHYIISSPSLWWPDTKSEGSIFQLQNDFKKSNDSMPVSIYAAIGEMEGEEDMRGPFSRWIELIEEHNYKNLSFEHLLVENGTHFSTIPVAYTKGLVWLNQKGEAANAAATTTD